jgi:isopentenyl-diphosphate delta-isomerase
MLQDRKKQHLDIVLSGKAHLGLRDPGFDDMRFEHVALPELSMEAIALGTRFLGKPIKLPFLVSSMTGGPAQAQTINHNLAIASETLGIPFAVGSQRVALEGGASFGIDRTIRQLAPTVPILANFGAVQLVTGFGAAQALRAVEMIEADGLILHLNPLQEAVQMEGDRNWSGVAGAIEALCRVLPVPVIAKEVGYGISPAVARRLVDAGVAVIDVAGAGGTSWSAVEAERSGSTRQAAVAAAFADWGQSTALGLRRLHAAHPDLPLIASGGIRSGVDAAKAIRLGAGLVGQAAAVLDAAMRICCFCTASRDLDALRSARLEEA